MKQGQTSLSQRFRQDISGQFAVWMGILALPLLIATTFVMDFYTAQEARTDLKAALDAAALAAVINQNITDTERGEYAVAHFDRNFTDTENFAMTVVESTKDRVELKAEGIMPASISAAAGFDGIHVNEIAAAELTRESVICVMTLNPDGERSFEITEGSTFNSPTCAVQVNSTHANASVVDQASSAVAKDFCVAGGASGAYSPYVNTECGVVDDPYEDKTAPAPGSCLSIGTIITLLTETLSVLTDNVIVAPGTYCNDIDVQGKNITFLPGTYIMNNAGIKFSNGSSARAEGVTFVMRGEYADIVIEDGSSLYMKAPSRGDLAGLAIFQDTDGANSNRLTATSELRGGSTMTIIGTVYLPTHELRIRSDSNYGNQAPATSFIAYDVAFEDGANASIAVNHVTAGLPPILPRSDEGARLVQ